MRNFFCRMPEKSSTAYASASPIAHCNWVQQPPRFSYLIPKTNAPPKVIFVATSIKSN